MAVSYPVVVAVAQEKSGNKSRKKKRCAEKRAMNFQKIIKEKNQRPKNPIKVVER